MKISLENIDALIAENMPFLIRVTSETTKRYVSIENDDAFSIALEAFRVAIEKYEEDKGPFFPFAKVVIENRLKNEYLKQQKEIKMTSMEVLEERGYQFSDEKQEEDLSLLREEIRQYKGDLAYFNLTFEALVDAAPKHKDTKTKAVWIARRASEDKEVVSTTYKKRKLPINLVASCCQVSEKVVKHSKQFILATMLIFIKKYPELNRWLKETRCYYDA